MVKLYRVIDLRTGIHYSKVIVSAQNARFFVPIEVEE